MLFILKVILALIFWAVFIWVVFFIEPPKSLTQANILQLVYFYIPLFLATALSLNILLKSVFAAGSLSLGLVFLLTLKALDLFNFLYVGLTLVATILLFSYFQKDFPSLTSLPFVRRLNNLQRRKRK